MTEVIKVDWDTRLYCSQCGSDDVHVQVGWDQKTGCFVSPLEASLNRDCCHCCGCDGDDLETLPELWREFTMKASQTDDYYRNGYLKSPLMNFEAGISTDEIVDWFEERCPNHSVKDLIDYDL